MTATGYLEEEIPTERLAHGYVRHDEALVREGTDPYGALASMGGVFTSVRDLAVWVAGFLDAFPARDEPEGSHPLRRASRREMQQLHRLIPASTDAHPAHAAPIVGRCRIRLRPHRAVGRGAGDVRVSHGGGYPGFGTQMAWHPASGLGLIGFANLRYGRIHPVVAEQLTELVRADVAPSRRARPTGETERMRAVVEGLLATWADEVADETFAMNMDLDEPRARRRAAIEKIAADLGPFRPDETGPPVSDSPFHLAWWLRGERGRVRVSILLSPEPHPRLQSLDDHGGPRSVRPAGGRGRGRDRRDERAGAAVARRPRAPARPRRRRARAVDGRGRRPVRSAPARSGDRG